MGGHWNIADMYKRLHCSGGFRCGRRGWSGRQSCTRTPCIPTQSLPPNVASYLLSSHRDLAVLRLKIRNIIIFNASHPMILVHMTPQCIPTWDKFVTILTIITRWHMFRLNVFVQMSSINSCVITISTHPRAIRFQDFGLDQLVDLLFRCK